MTLTERLAKINESREKRKARIADKSGRRRSVGYEFRKLVLETCQAMKIETKIEKETA
jgi:hypothetical protein